MLHPPPHPLPPFPINHAPPPPLKTSPAVNMAEILLTGMLNLYSNNQVIFSHLQAEVLLERSI